MSDSTQSGATPQKTLCFVTQSFSFGGTEVHTLGVIRALVERGYRIVIIACLGHREYDRVLAADDLREHVSIIHRQIDVDDSGMAAFLRWKELLKSTRSETLIFPKGDSRLGSITFLRACRSVFKKIIVIEHLESIPLPQKASRRLLGVFPAGLGLWWHRMRFVMKLRSSYADRIIAVSGKVKECLTQDWGIAPDKIAVIRNGVRWQDYSRDEARGAAFRARYGLPADAFIFGMATRLARLKAIDVALQALHLLLEKNIGRVVYLVIAGEGEQAQNLAALTTGLNLDGHVKFIGFVQDARDALSGYDVILFPSRREGLPLGLLEGMAAGCIPIVTRISGMPEAVDSPELGWVVPVEDPESLCAAMQSVLECDAETIAQMRSNVARRIRDDFDVAECHRKIIEACGL